MGLNDQFLLRINLLTKGFKEIKQDKFLKKACANYKSRITKMKLAAALQTIE